MRSKESRKDSQNSPFLSIIVPVYNEEDNVKILYEEIRKSIGQLNRPFEIIFVDDGSLDRTSEYLKNIKESEKKGKNNLIQTRIIRFSGNFGQTAAMQAGFDNARGEIIISMDGDLQNDPKDIPKLLFKLQEGYDVVCGWRKNRQDKIITRVVPSKIANWLIAKITGIHIHDNGCSLKAYRNKIIKSISLYSDMHRFTPAITSLLGARIAEIVVNHRPRKYGTPKYGLSRIWKVLFDIITIQMLIHFRHRPILWFATFGSIFFLLGLGFAVASFLLFMQGERSIVYSGVSFLLLYLFGSFLSWGLLAEFFAK